MKKLLVILLVLAFVAPAMAEDRLSLSGSMRARAWSVENSDFTDADTSDEAYWDQRFRMQAVISPADGVKGVFRVDFAEDTWGSANWEGSRYGSGSELQVDRAYLDVTKGMVNIKAGQQYMGLGNTFAYDDNAVGVQLTLKTPVTVRLGYNKRHEGDEHDETGAEDTDRYFIDVGYKSDALSVNGFYAMQKDDDDLTQDEPTLMGVMAQFAAGPATILAELNSFGGSYGSGASEVDYTGLQFVANAAMKFSDAFTGVFSVFYSDGEDEADEEKITMFAGSFGSTAYSDLGPFNTDIMPLGSDDVFDPGSTNSGAMGASVYVKFMPMEALSLHAQLAYLTADEDGTDSRADGFDDGMVYGVAADYQLTQNATVAAEYRVADWDSIEGADIEAKEVMVARIQITY